MSYHHYYGAFNIIYQYKYGLKDIILNIWSDGPTEGHYIEVCGRFKYASGLAKLKLVFLSH